MNTPTQSNTEPPQHSCTTPDDSIQAVYNNILHNQQPLGHPFEEILYANLWELYCRDSVTELSNSCSHNNFTNRDLTIMNIPENTTITIPFSDNTEISLMFAYETAGGPLVCRASRELIEDIQDILRAKLIGGTK